MRVVSTQSTEIDDPLLDLIERLGQADSERKKVSEEKNEKMEEDLVNTEKIRKNYFETFSETRKRKAESEKKTCRSTSDTINFLTEKCEREHEL